MNEVTQLTGILLSMKDMIDKLNSFFTDSVILRMDYKIEAIGKDLESLMEYSSQEISGNAFESICADPNFQTKLNSLLKSGYFTNIPCELLTRKREFLRVVVSGFYLGLISEINGFIILKVKLADDNSSLKKQLSTKKRELDSFIYRTAHDLRGPLATIKGLVNLLKMRQSNEEVDELTSLIDVHANKLDDRLFKLLYLANTNSQTEDCRGVVDFEVLKSRLTRILNDNFQLDKAKFYFNAPVDDQGGINEQIFYQLISNIFLYIISLPVESIAQANVITLHVDVNVQNLWLNVMIRSHGFVTSGKIREAIHKPTSLYTDLLSYPFLFNYYVAQKEVMQLHALFRIDFHGESEQVVQLSVPLTFSQDVKHGATPVFPASLNN